MAIVFHGYFSLGSAPEGAPCGKEKIEIKERKGELEGEKMELWQ